MFALKNQFPELYAYQGRKVSKKLSLSKKNLINTLYSDFSLDKTIIEYHKAGVSKKKINIPNTFSKVNLEIGFGNGDFLVKSANSKPEELFIGVEVYINGIAKVLRAISTDKLKNIILCNLNSFYLLKAMPCKSVDKIYIINPDPWIKKRHNKRRLFSLRTLKLLNQIIKSKNSIYMTTDSESYLKDIESLLNDHQEHCGEYKVSILTKNDELYGISRYQQKTIEKGGKIYQLTF